MLLREDNGISVMPMNQKFTHYHALVKGPENSPFAGGFFQICVKFEARDPSANNQIQVSFLTPIYHPGVFWRKGYEGLDMFQTSTISFPSVLKKGETPVGNILTDLRYDFLLKPDPFFHEPANVAALADMFVPSRKKLELLQLEKKFMIQSRSMLIT